MSQSVTQCKNKNRMNGRLENDATVQRQRQCTCCPYGFHIDVDFLNSLERFSKKTTNECSRPAQLKNPVQETQNLNDLMNGLSKYLDEVTQLDASRPRAKLFTLRPLLTGSEAHVTPVSGQRQTVPRTLHRQNLIKNGGLTPTSSRSFSEDERQKTVSTRMPVDASFRSFDARKSKPPTRDELLEMKSQVKVVLDRLALVKDREETIASLEKKINCMISERENLILKLCGRCKNIAEGSQASRVVCRSQSLKAFKQMATNQKTQGGIPAPTNGKSQASILTKTSELHHHHGGGHSKREVDRESEAPKSPQKLPTTTTPQTKGSNQKTTTSTKSHETMRNANPVQVSKIPLLPRLNEAPTRASAAKPSMTSMKDSKPVSKIPFARPSMKFRNCLKVEVDGASERKLQSRVPATMRSNSFDGTGCPLDHLLSVAGGSSSSSDDDENLRVDGSSVSGRKEQRGGKTCRRSLSLVAQTSRARPKIHLRLSSSEEEEFLNGYNSECTSDQSSTSFDEGAYDGELGQIIYKQKLPG